MANEIEVSQVIYDAITGQQTGTLLATRHVMVEHWTGNGSGLFAPAAVQSAIKDVWTGAQVGSLMRNQFTTKEVITGDRVGMDLQPEFTWTIKEVIGRDSSYKFQSVLKEVIISAPDDIVTISRQVGALRETTLQARPPTQDPATVRSFTPIYQLVEEVLQKTARPGPISMESVKVLRHITLAYRPKLPPASVFSILTMKAARQLVLVSRSIPYTPVSGIFVPTLRQVATRRRSFTAAPDVRSPVLARTERQIVLLSKREPRIFAKQFVSIALRTRYVTFPPIRTMTTTQNVLQQRLVETPRSMTYAGSLAQQIVAHRETPGIVWSDITAYTHVQQALQYRVTGPQRSDVYAAQQMQITLSAKVPDVRPSDLYAAQVAQVTLAVRVPSPLPYTGEEAAQLLQTLLVHRETAPPNAISSWDVKTLARVHLIGAPAPMHHSFTEVRSQRVQYLLAQDYPPPEEVMGPEVGAQVMRYREIAIQHRDTEPPSEANRSRTVYDVKQQLVLNEAFPDPAIPYSDLDTHSLAQGVGIVDDSYPDPMQAFSDAVVMNAVMSVVVAGEPWPDPTVPLSDAEVSSIGMQLAAMDDSFGDPTQAFSDLTVFDLAAQTVVGDAQFPDPSLPVSELSVQLVGAAAVLGDPSFLDPNLPTSPIDVSLLQLAVVIRDKTLLSIPARLDRRRPSVTIAIS